MMAMLLRGVVPLLGVVITTGGQIGVRRCVRPRANPRRLTPPSPSSSGRYVPPGRHACRCCRYARHASLSTKGLGPARRAGVGQASGSGAGARPHHQFLHHSVPVYPPPVCFAGRLAGANRDSERGRTCAERQLRQPVRRLRGARSLERHGVSGLDRSAPGRDRPWAARRGLHCHHRSIREGVALAPRRVRGPLERNGPMWSGGTRPPRRFVRAPTPHLQRSSLP
jgi:hypothetical protein